MAWKALGHSSQPGLSSSPGHSGAGITPNTPKASCRSLPEIPFVPLSEASPPLALLDPVQMSPLVTQTGLPHPLWFPRLSTQLAVDPRHVGRPPSAPMLGSCSTTQLLTGHSLLLPCGGAFHTCPHTLGGRGNSFPVLLTRNPKCRKAAAFAQSYMASGHWSPDADPAGPAPGAHTLPGSQTSNHALLTGLAA